MLLAAASLCLACAGGPFAHAATTVDLWAIGRPDHDNRDFALAPNRYHEFTTDGLFVVGASDPRRDWPYVQPGPSDSWAGSRQHTFTVLFGLKVAPAAGECRLRFDLLDAQHQAPPRLRVTVNGHTFEHSLRAGSGDESINGEPGQGLAQSFAIPFPAGLLKAGDNEVRITTLSGSWFLYDALRLETPADVEGASVASRTVVEGLEAVRAVREEGGRQVQPVRLTVRHYGEPVEATVRVAGATPVTTRVGSAPQDLEVWVPAVTAETTVSVDVQTGGQRVAETTVSLRPVRPLTVYILPHSHTDIGYTEIQTAVQAKQVNNLLEGIAYARQTATNPPGARFVWNVEVLWAADLYLHRLSDAQRAEFLAAVRQGQVALNGMYLNELTGLCRPEELVQLFRYATELERQCGVTIDAAMISDVPGYTWGTVTAMAQAGIKYFSAAPNYFDRIGDILVQWENKPFYWVGPDGRDKVLVWIPYMGYALSHIVGRLTPRFVGDYEAHLEQTHYPYEIAYIRWSGHGDNAVPDPAICDFVKDWNSRYLWPKFIIASTSQAFRAFAQRYGATLPRARGDWTPYWEDGAGSSAKETALNRNASDRLVQAETLWALIRPAAFPAATFAQAWRNVLLYSEHTWGAWCSVSDPENQMTKEQWAIKRDYAVRADEESQDLTAQALAALGTPDPAAGLDLFNTTSWSRTELVRLDQALSLAGDRVLDDHGRPVPSQRLTDGRLAFLARNVPPLAARRYTVTPGQPLAPTRPATVASGVLDNGILRVGVDAETGGITELRARKIPNNFADTSQGQALNEYLFLPGDDLAHLERNGPATLSPVERGPLVCSLRITSPAPACRKLTREVLVVAGLGYAQVCDVVDKARAAISPRPGDGTFAQRGGKESVNFGFPFGVPGGEVRLEVPLGLMRPEVDQIPGACKNWFTVGRWAEVANSQFGITWITLDAPLVEVGELSARLLGSQTNPAVWRKHVATTQRLYAWAMNNHWGTNYRAYQEGPVAFRFVLWPHRAQAPAAASRLAIGLSQPLVATPARGARPSPIPRLRVEPAEVLVTALKPSDDGRAWIVRLFGASNQRRQARLTWASPAPRAISLSGTDELPHTPLHGPIEVPGWGLVTVRAELP